MFVISIREIVFCHKSLIIGMAKKFAWIFLRYYGKTRMNFLTDPIYDV